MSFVPQSDYGFWLDLKLFGDLLDRKNERGLIHSSSPQPVRAPPAPLLTQCAGDGSYVVVADLPKRVKWDQKKLAVAIKTIVDEWRDDPAQYVTTEYKISETGYGAWPTVVRKLFEPARTVETGKPTFRIEPLQKETF